MTKREVLRQHTQALRAEREDLRQRLCFGFSDRSSSDGWAAIWATRIAQIERELQEQES